jgi:superfamily II DNA helicase RecQ
MTCKSCRYGVLPSQVESHLSGPKHRMPRARRQQIQEEIATWPELFRTEADLVRLEIPTHRPPPCKELDSHNDGRKCHICNHIVRTDERIKKHYRTQHGWVNSWKRGRKAGDRQRAGLSTNRPWIIDVHCQRFFTHGPKQQYFEVQGPSASNAAPDNSLSKWDQARRRLTQSWTAVKDIEKRIIQEGQPDEVNPWLERTGWQTYLGGLDRGKLIQSVSAPDEENEPVNAVIWQIMDELIQRCQHSVIHNVGVFVRLEAIRTEKHQNRYQPLQPYMDAEGFGKYSRPWKQILMFFARTQEEHEWESPQYEFTEQQSRAWQILLCEAQKIVTQRDESSSNNDNSDNSTDSDDGDSMNVLTDAHKACLQFCYELLQQTITRKEYDSVLVCALAVLGVKSDGWMGVNQYPPILSAMIKISRFMVVQQALEFEKDEDPFSPKFVGCLTWVKRTMDRFMVRGSHSPMQWMLDLRTYGMKIFFSSTADGHIDWQGDTVLYKKIQFTMADFRGMVHGLVAEAKRILFEKLLFAQEDEIPPIPWEKLRDDPVNKQPGWNFTQDERNAFAVDGGEWWLFERIGRDAKLRRRFVKSGPNFAWNKVEVEEYMGWVIRNRELMLILKHITGGQPPRSPEMFSVRHSNTIKGEYRNEFIEDQLVVYVTRYHKGYSVSGDVKVIHRYLPREVGELWVWYMWLVLPWQQKLEVDVWKKTEISSHMWPPDPDGKKWTSERMRKAIKKESVVGMGVELGIQSYRELAIAISRRYLRNKQAFRPDEDDEDGDRDEDAENDIADEQAGHSSHIAGTVYARGIMERDGEVASKRQRFRESSVAWHRFLGFEPGPDEIGIHDRKRKRAPFEEEYEEGRIDRCKRLRATNIHDALKQMMGEKAEFRGVQEPAIKAIMAGESPVVVVMGTGGGKSLLFMLPAFCSSGGVTAVVVPLIALRQDMKRRCQAMGITCREWESRRPPDGARVILVTPESAVKEGFRKFVNRMKATQQLDRIVIDECHMVLNDKMDFRKQMQQLGELCGVGVQMVLLTATLPPSKEAELWKRMDFCAEEVRLFRAITRRRNVRYAVQEIEGQDAAEKQEAVVQLVHQKMTVYPQGKTVVYCNSVNKVKALAEALGCDGYYHDAEDKEEKLQSFMQGKKKIIVATSALGLGIDIPDIRVIWHVDPPRTLLDYAQESGRAGRDGLKSEAIMIVGWDVGDYGEKKEDVELVQQLIGSSEGCRKAVLGRYLDGLEGQTCKEGEVKCDQCEDPVDSMFGDIRDEEIEEIVAGMGEQSEEADRQEADRRETRTVMMQQQRQQIQGRRGQERMQQEGVELEKLEQQLRRVQGKCPSCMQDGVVNHHHLLFRCQEENSEQSRKDYRALKEAIRKGRTMEKYSGCMDCFLPQEWCNQWEQSERQGGMYRRKAGVKCAFQDVVLSGFVVGLGEAKRVEEVRGRMTKQGYDITKEEDVLKYIGQKRIWGGLETSQLLKEYYLIHQE